MSQSFVTAKPGNQPKPTILLCDDHPMIQDGLKSLLESSFEILGATDNGRSLLEMVTSLLPAAVILDINLPLMGGLEASRQLNALEVKPKIIVYSMCDGPAYVRESFRVGASAYVSKACSPSELVKAVWAALRGRQFVSLPRVEGEMFLFNGNSSSLLPFSDLTPRQREVLQLVGEGYSAKKIAAELKITQKTVEFHKNSIMTALHLRSTAEIVRFAVESGLVGTMADPNSKPVHENQTL